MGKLFDYIKERYEVIKEFDKLKREDFIKTRGFDTYRKAYIEYMLVGKVIEHVNRYCKLIIGDKFKDYINKNKDDLSIDNDGIVVPSIYDDLNDIEKALNDVEALLDKDQVNLLLESTKSVIEKNTQNPLRVFNEVMGKIKDDLKELAPTEEEISEEEKKEIIDSLNYADSVFVENRNDGIYDDIIDDLSVLSKQERINLPEYAQEVGISAEDVNAVDYGTNSISISFNDEKNYDKFAPVLNQKLRFTEEYKNKIRALDNYISQKSIIKNPINGETSYKEYAFMDWFTKAFELKEEIMANHKLPNDKRAEKIESYKKIITLKKELENITNEYKDVLNYIKTNFDINNISLPGNIYSGRNYKLIDGDLDNFRLNLPEMFDLDNAGYGVLLNGYGQLKGFLNSSGITLDEFLEDPLKVYYKTCDDCAKRIDAQFVLPRNGNTLGKRMARMLYQPERKYNELKNAFVNNRAVEFLVNAQDNDENTFFNKFTQSFATSFATMTDHQAVNLFEVGNTNNSEIKKLFAFGDSVDNLLTVSKHYRDINTITNGNKNEFNYENRIHEMKDVNPASVCNNLLETLKDYLAERKYLNDHINEFCDVKEYEDYVRRFEPVRMIYAAKEYFEDFIYKNDINISKIKDKDDRQLVIDFLCNPAELLENKYKNVPNLVITEKKETLKKYIEDFGNLVRPLHNDDVSSFNTNFALNNSKPNGFNSNKDMMTIIRDNSGSKWEKFFKSTSNEYNALVDALCAALDPESATCGDFTFVKYCAKKYLEHKLPAGSSEAKISETGRRRIEFCRTILNSFNELDDKYKEVTVNEPAIDIKGPSIGSNNQNNIENHNFQEEIKEEIQKDIIEDVDNQKEIIEIKEDIQKDQKDDIEIKTE